MVIRAVEGKIHIPGRIQTLVYDIRAMLSGFTSIAIQHDFREGNMATD